MVVLRAPGWLALAFLVGSPGVAAAYGEPDAEGSPSARERLLHVLTNQIRQAPHDWPGWNTSQATPDARRPLGLSPGLLAAARFHATDMAVNDCFSHASCDGTDTFVRIGRYFDGQGAGENIYFAEGFDDVRASLTGWLNSDGHRRNMLDPNWNLLGTGYASADRRVYYVQNFGRQSQASVPVLVGGAHENTAGGHRLLATYYDPRGQAPNQVTALLGGDTIPLTQVSGVPGNETLTAEVATLDACTGLVFEAETADGLKDRFPSTGELRVGPDCAHDFEVTSDVPSTGGPVYIDANDDAGFGCRATGRSRPGAPLAALWVALLGLAIRMRPRRD